MLNGAHSRDLYDLEVFYFVFTGFVNFKYDTLLKKSLLQLPLKDKIPVPASH